jgi:hypothetical protein
MEAKSGDLENLIRELNVDRYGNKVLLLKVPDFLSNVWLQSIQKNEKIGDIEFDPNDQTQVRILFFLFLLKLG